MERSKSAALLVINPTGHQLCYKAPRSAVCEGFCRNATKPRFHGHGLLAAAGKRSEPPISLPWAIAPIPAITADPALQKSHPPRHVAPMGCEYVHEAGYPYRRERKIQVYSYARSQRRLHPIGFVRWEHFLLQWRPLRP